MLIMAGMSDSFTLLQRLSGSFAQADRLNASHRRSAIRWARALGSTAVPLCARELEADDESRASWAFTLLLELSDAGLRERVCEAMRKVAAGAASDRAKLRALAMLADLGEESVDARLADPQAARAESMKKLANSLSTQVEIAQAASMIVAQLPEEDLVSFMRDLIDVDSPGGCALTSELLIREDIDPGVRAQLEPLLTDAAPKKLPKPRSKRRSLVARHTDGHALLISWARRRKTDPPRYRSATALVDHNGELLEFRYGDDATATEIEKKLIGGFINSGFEIESEDPTQAKDELLDALKRTSSSSPLPAEFYLGRDLFDLALSEHLNWRPRPAVDGELTLDRGCEAGRSGGVFAAEV